MLRRLTTWLLALAAGGVAGSWPAGAVASPDEELRRLDQSRSGEERGACTPGAAALLLPSSQAEVARIRLADIPPEGDADDVLAALLWSCRERGDLKVQLLLPDNDAAWPLAVEAARRSGFLYSRQRRVQGEQVIEFYVDLYAAPRRPTAAR